MGVGAGASKHHPEGPSSQPLRFLASNPTIVITIVIIIAIIIVIIIVIIVIVIIISFTIIIVIVISITKGPVLLGPIWLYSGATSVLEEWVGIRLPLQIVSPFCGCPSIKSPTGWGLY